MTKLTCGVCFYLGQNLTNEDSNFQTLQSSPLPLILNLFLLCLLLVSCFALND